MLTVVTSRHGPAGGDLGEEEAITSAGSESEGTLDRPIGHPAFPPWDVELASCIGLCTPCQEFNRFKDR